MNEASGATAGDNGKGCIDELARRRKLYLDAVDANEGAINLDIFEDFYPDQGHFVLELLQNAEDAGANHAIFELAKEGCVFRHDGKKLFTCEDVDSITGIHHSTKRNTPDQIGKFGVGFKSVYLYTKTPSVVSGRFSFRVRRLVLPEWFEEAEENGTRFWLPFDNPDKQPSEAYKEVEEALSRLSHTSLLFLSNITAVEWTLSQGNRSRVERVKHSDVHYEIRRMNGKRISEARHFLRFEEPRPGDRKPVMLAYELNSLPNRATFDDGVSLKNQFRIAPANPGRVAVYFPAEKESSGLRFHVHGPFVPELSRASIKEAEINKPLFKALANLAADSLTKLKELGLLTRDFLEVLPNRRDTLPPRYHEIRDSILHRMQTTPITPTHDGKYAPASCLLQGKAPVKALLEPNDLLILAARNHAGRSAWAVTATQRNSDVDRLLDDLEIPEFTAADLARALAGTGSIYGGNTQTQAGKQFMERMSSKSLEWHQQLYALLSQHLLDNGHETATFKSVKIVRLRNGGYEAGAKVFFPAEGSDAALPTVHPEVYSAGSGKAEQQAARRFLEQVGVREVSETELVEALLQERYAGNSKPSDAQYPSDLARFVGLVEKDKENAPLFETYPIIKTEGGVWCKPGEAYLDAPISTTGMGAFHAAKGAPKTRNALSRWYAEGTKIPLDRLRRFFEAIGVHARLEAQHESCESNPDWPYLSSVPGERYATPKNEDWTIEGLHQAFDNPSLELARLVWNTMELLPPKHLKATYQKNMSSGSRESASQLVHVLRQASWVPTKDGTFVRPEEASAELLPPGFRYDAGSKWLAAVQFGTSVVKRTQEEKERVAATKEELGISDDAQLERIRRLAKLPPGELEAILAQHDQNRPSVSLPTRTSGDPARRSERVAKDAEEAPGRETEMRVRSVSKGLPRVKDEAVTYLREQYTNDRKQMICQACKGILPFQFENGEYYFEAVELLPTLRKRHYQNYVALCPNHAAMFMHANPLSDEALEELVRSSDSVELEVVLAQKPCILYFTQQHLEDLKAVITTEHRPEREAEA